MLCLVARFNNQVRRYRIPAEPQLLGSSQQTDLPLPATGVSSIHARVTPTADGVLLSDLGSKNRLIVAGERRDQVELRPGLVVQVGRALLTIEDGPTPDIELGLITSQPAREPDEGTDTSAHSPDTSGSSPQGALRLVREMEDLSPSALKRRRAEFLRKSCATLECESLLIVALDPELRPSLVAIHGAEPDETIWSRFEIVIQQRGRRQRKVRQAVSHHAAGEWHLLLSGMRGRSPHQIMAAFFRRSEAPEAWRRDLFAYVAGKLLPEQHADAMDASADEGALVFPAEMVVGDSPAVRGLLAGIRATVKGQMHVLLTGETGTGKELFARMIHASGPASAGPFVPVNCAAIPSELLEAELFGVQGRVATGVDPRPGLFLQANGGSIFLDEIGELAAALQAKLLRVLQEREILPLGAPAPRKISVRVIAASNHDLLERVRTGHFRKDLYYRLRGLQFHIPPLRDRKEEIAPLVLAFVDRFAIEYGKRISGVSRGALKLLMEHDWPGNVRELQNEVERAVLLCDHGTLQSEHFAPIRWVVEQERVRESAPSATLPEAPQPPSTPNTLHDAVDAVERKAIVDALRLARGNRTRAAKMLGITRNGLAMKMDRLKISTD
jgi:DNA-binding NtrC family response regulator